MKKPLALIAALLVLAPALVFATPAAADKIYWTNLKNGAVGRANLNGTHVDRSFIRGAEALFDVGSHILAGEFQESVDEYREIPGRLRARAVLSAETARRLDGLAGFRNVLVHEYADVDLRRVHAGLDRLADFDAFLADYGLNDRLLFGHPTFGNSSTAITGGALWRSLPRLGLTRAVSQTQPGHDRLSLLVPDLKRKERFGCSRGRSGRR